MHTGHSELPTPTLESLKVESVSAAEAISTLCPQGGAGVNTEGNSSGHLGLLPGSPLFMP